MTSTSPAWPDIEIRDGVVLVKGNWSAAGFAEPEAWNAVARTLASVPRGADWVISGVARLDHLGAAMLLRHWGDAWPQQLQATAVQRALLERVATPLRPPAPTSQRVWKHAFLALGAGVIAALGHAAEFVRMIGQLFLDLLAALRAPRRAPWHDFSGNLYAMGYTALPITAMVGFLIGVVLAYLMAQVLRQFGAETYIVNMIGLALVRELGPLLAAVLVAGRSGSAITAQIGVMRVTEEIDAMRVLGIPQGFRLVLPRAAALAVAMPLVSVWTTMAGIVGGMVAADLTLDVKPAYFIEAMPKAVDVAHLWLATAKSVVFGIGIALIGCYCGLRVQPNTQSLGQGTTTAVVSAITMVIVVDAVFAVAFRNVGSL